MPALITDPKHVTPPQHPAHTGARMTPETRARIIHLRGSGVPIKRVIAEVGCSPHTVAAAERQDPELLASLRQRRAEAWELLEQMCVEELIEKVQAGEVNASQLGINGGIAHDKASALRGEATHRVEVMHTVADPADLAQRAKKLLDSAKAKNTAQVIDIE